MFTPREQQQNPGCLDETLSRYILSCHSIRDARNLSRVCCYCGYVTTGSSLRAACTLVSHSRAFQTQGARCHENHAGPQRDSRSCTSHAAASDAGLLPCTSQSQCEGPRANASHRLPTPRCAKIENTSCAIFRATVQPRSRSVALAAAASVLENGIYTACCTSHAAASDAGLLSATSRGAADSSHAPRGFWPLSAQLERCARAPADLGDLAL